MVALSAAGRVSLLPTTNSGALASIIIVNYNGSTLVLDCLQSVEDEIDVGCEVLVVDNGSTDGSAAEIRERFPDIILLQNDTNVGFAAACNQGAEAASGTYLVFLNPDTIVCRGWLSELLTALNEDENVGLVTSKALLMKDPSRIQACGLDVHYTGLIFARGFGAHASAYIDTQTVTGISGSSFAIRAELWRRLGGFDERFFMYYEDTDLSWRACLLGYHALCVPKSVIYHAHGHPASATRLSFTTRNRWLLLLKNWRCSTLVLLLPSLVLAEAVDAVNLFRVAGRRGIRAKIQAYQWIIDKRKSVWNAHRITQSSRQIADYEVLRNMCAELNPQEYELGHLASIALRGLNVVFRFHYDLSCAVLRALHL